MFALVQACSEHPDDIGLELIDTRAQVHMIDTLSIRAMTTRVDSIYLPLAAGNILGLIDDPVFGKSRSGIYAETRLPENNLFLGEDPTLDSVFLVLRYTGDYYGFPSDFQRVFVHELSERFPAVDSLYSNITIPHHPEPITRGGVAYTFRPAPSDSVMVDSILRPPQLRIPLSDAFGYRLINASGTEAFANMANYLEEFNGLYVKMDEAIKGLGAKFRVDLLSQFSAIELYYHAADDTVQQMQRFPINEYSARANTTDHFGYADAHEFLQRQVNDQDQAAADSLLFLQAPGTLRPHLYFPYLETLKREKSLLVNKAELIVPVEEGMTPEDLPATPLLYLARIDEDGNLRLLDDYYIGPEFFGGRLDEDAMQYTFNIAVYLQKLLDGVLPQEEIALIFTNPSREMSRTVVHGPGRAERPMQLIIFYSEFE